MQLRTFLDWTPDHKGCMTWESERIQADIESFLCWVSAFVSQELLANLQIEFKILKKDKTETDDVVCFVHNQGWEVYRLVLNQRNDRNNHRVDFFDNLKIQKVSQEAWTQDEETKIVLSFFEEIFDKLAINVDLTEFEEYKIWLANQNCKKLIDMDGQMSEIYIFNLPNWERSLGCILKIFHGQDFYYNFFMTKALANNDEIWK